MPKYLVEMLVIDLFVKKRFECGKLVIVSHKPNAVELSRPKNYFNFVIVPVQSTARMLGRQIPNDMGRRKGKCLTDRVHGQRVG